MGVLQGLLVGLQVSRHAIEALAEIGELVAAGDGDAMGEVALGELAGAAHELGKRRRASRCNRRQHQRERGEDGERGMDLADALEPAQELCRVGVDPDHLGGLVGDADLDQLVQLLIDAAFEQVDQPLPGDVGTAAAPQLLDLVELVQSVLELLSGSVRGASSSADSAFCSSGPTMASSLSVRSCSVARSESITLCR